MKQCDDLLEECEVLRTLLSLVTEEGFTRVTQFKGWSINHVMQHLHFFDKAAMLSLSDPEALMAQLAELRAAQAGGEEMRDYTERALNGLSGPALMEAWRNGYRELVAAFRDVDPKTRLKWSGPDMSARSSITARLMETWAHGQEVFDALGAVREEGDRIHNVVVMGNNTFGWTFSNRGEVVPESRPFLVLTAPSGVVWELNEFQEDNRIEGTAIEFCQVVTQTRNIGDTSLRVTGETARRWMAFAQCFAGSPKDPPAPGTRFRQV